MSSISVGKSLVSLNSRVSSLQAKALGTSFAASTITGLAGWWAFSDPTTVYTDAGTTLVSADAQAIYRVSDKSGNGNHLDQATLGSRPLFKLNQANGYSVGRFDGSDDWTATPGTSFVLGTAGAVVSVMKRVGAGDANARFWHLGQAGQSGVFDNSSTWSYYSDNADGVVAMTDANTSFCVVSVVYTSAAAAKAYVNGTLRATFDPKDEFSNGVRFILGGDAITGDDSANCDHAECLVTTTALTAAQHNSLGSFWAAKYGTSSWTTVV